MGSLLHSYRNHPRLYWSVFITVCFLVLLLQAYLGASPEQPFLLDQFLFPIIVVVSGFVLLAVPKQPVLFVTGFMYLILCTGIFFFEILPNPYGTFCFLLGIWLVVDWLNYKKHKTSIFFEIINGNTRIAAGVFLSTFVFGLLTEYINIPFGIWSYHIPIPMTDVLGIPALIAAFGWTPWTLSILAIFYYFLSGGQGQQEKVEKEKRFYP
jgi:hypothetical protein